MTKPTTRELITSTHELVWIVLFMNIAIIGYICLTEYRLSEARAELEKAEKRIEKVLGHF